MPKLRRQTFETAIIERYRRRKASVEEALIEMYLAGVSVRRVEDITEALWGTLVRTNNPSRAHPARDPAPHPRGRRVPRRTIRAEPGHRPAPAHRRQRTVDQEVSNDGPIEESSRPLDDIQKVSTHSATACARSEAAQPNRKCEKDRTVPP